MLVDEEKFVKKKKTIQKRQLSNMKMIQKMVFKTNLSNISHTF